MSDVFKSTDHFEDDCWVEGWSRADDIAGIFALMLFSYLGLVLVGCVL